MMLKVSDLCKRYPGVEDEKAAVRGISFEVPEGEIFTLLGPSGCGKTTTLRSVAGLEIPNEGVIEIDGQCVFSSVAHTVVPAHHRPISMVFQSYAVWPHLTVLRNVMYPLKAAHVPKAEARRRAMEALEAVGLGEVAERTPGALSGGQQQRVALARAIVRNTKLLLLDEPLSNLDAKLRVQMREEIRSLQRRLGATVLYVTHDQDEAMTLSDHVAVMRAGVIVERNTPSELYGAPKDLFTAQFMGENNLVEVTMRSSGRQTIVESPFGTLYTNHFHPGDGTHDAYYFFVRPETIELKRDESTRVDCGPNQFRGTVVDATFLGKLNQYRVVVADHELTVQRVAEQLLSPGERVLVTVDADNSAVYAVDKAVETVAPPRNGAA